MGLAPNCLAEIPGCHSYRHAGEGGRPLVWLAVKYTMTTIGTLVFEARSLW